MEATASQPEEKKDTPRFDALTTCLNETFLSMMKTHSGDDSWELQPVNATYATINGHWMAIILLSGPELRITFKVFFMGDDAKAFTARVYRTSYDEISLKQAQDFMKEYCNLMAGQLKKILLNNNFTLGISLPSMLKGFDDVFSPSDKEERMYSEQIVLVRGKSKVYCESVVELMSEKLDYSSITIEEEEEEEIEFL